MGSVPAHDPSSGHLESELYEQPYDNLSKCEIEQIHSLICYGSPEWIVKSECYRFNSDNPYSEEVRQIIFGDQLSGSLGVLDRLKHVEAVVYGYDEGRIGDKVLGFVTSSSVSQELAKAYLDALIKLVNHTLEERESPCRLKNPFIRHMGYKVNGRWDSNGVLDISIKYQGEVV